MNEKGHEAVDWPPMVCAGHKGGAWPGHRRQAITHLTKLFFDDSFNANE